MEISCFKNQITRFAVMLWTDIVHKNIYFPKRLQAAKWPIMPYAGFFVFVWKQIKIPCYARKSQAIKR